MRENGADDGTRTRDNSDHNRGLYQLSYDRHMEKPETGFNKNARLITFRRAVFNRLFAFAPFI